MHETDQKKDYALNIARALGFQKYNFIVVINGLEGKVEKVKGKTNVISLDALKNYLFENDSFESTLVELNIVNNLLNKYGRQDNQDELIKDLKDLKYKIEQVNK